MKTKCSEKQDTECQECLPGYDWSNNTSLEPCMGQVKLHAVAVLVVYFRKIRVNKINRRL